MIDNNAERRVDPANDGLSYWSNSQFLSKNSGLRKFVGKGIQIQKGLSLKFPPVNAFKVNNKYTIMIASPGLSEHEFSVTVFDGSVNPRIKVATTRNQTNVTSPSLLIHEIDNTLDFELLIEAVDNEIETILPEDVTATHKDGILSVVFNTLQRDPRQPGETVKSIPINVKSETPPSDRKEFRIETSGHNHVEESINKFLAMKRAAKTRSC